MQAKTTREQGEVLVPFEPSRALAPIATHIRSTMITSSVASLRARGLFEEYRSHLPPELRDEIPATVAGSWLPMETGIQHYSACNALRLSVPELLSIGESVGDRSTKSALSLVTKLAAGSGVTPWTVFTNSRRLWERAFQGSSISVVKLGPKEARFEIIAWPLAGIEYNRVSFRGILRSMLQPFCIQAYVHELTPLCTPMSASYRAAWA
jgi:hypothetical protein